MRQFTIGLERELFKDTSVSVTYINRSFQNFIGPYNALATYEAVPYEINSDIPGAVNRNFTLYNRTSGDAAEWHVTNLYKIKDLYKDVTGQSTNPYRKYWGFEFLFNKRFSNRWQLMASYVYSQTKGTIDNSTYEDIGWGRATTDPNFWVNADGHMTNDPTHMIKIQGTYLLPFGLPSMPISTRSREPPGTSSSRPKAVISPRGKSSPLTRNRRVPTIIPWPRVSISGSRKRSPWPTSTGWDFSSTFSTSSMTIRSRAGGTGSGSTGIPAKLRRRKGTSF